MPTEEYADLSDKISRLDTAITNIGTVSLAAAEILSDKVETVEQSLVATIDRLNGLVCTARATEAAIKQHFTTHNQGGGIIERAGVPLLDALTALVEKAEADRQAILADLSLLRLVFTEGRDE